MFDGRSRAAGVLAVAALGAALLGATARSATAAALCVGPQPGCFTQIQPAVNAAHDGDTITVAAGTFTGVVTIDKSIHLQGAGAGKTTIMGGGPVVTIARAADPAGLNVSIDGVTITGGINDSSPDDAVTFGGGVSIPVAQLDHPPFNGTGATVAISNSVITGNQVLSHAVIPPGFCGPHACGFNNGGGIDNGGVLTVTNTLVTNNTSGSTASLGSAASDAGSGGINNHFASTLVLHNSVVSGNHVLVNSAIASGASSGGIGSTGALDIEDSVVSDNTVQYAGSLGQGDQVALAGGITIDECGPCGVPHPTPTIHNTQISGNRVVADNTASDATPAGFGGGIVAFAPAQLDRVALTDNQVQVTSGGFAGGDGGGMEVDAPVTVRDSIIARNSVVASGPSGAIAFGGGVAMFGADLTLEHTLVTANSASGSGAAAPLPFGGVSSVFGGGISNGGPGGTGIPPGALTVTDSVITANRLSGSAGFLMQGGGVFTTGGISRTHTVVAGNKPDDCFGC
jgi:hypothetical protein